MLACALAVLTWRAAPAAPPSLEAEDAREVGAPAKTARDEVDIASIPSADEVPAARSEAPTDGDVTADEFLRGEQGGMRELTLLLRPLTAQGSPVQRLHYSFRGDVEVEPHRGSVAVTDGVARIVLFTGDPSAPSITSSFSGRSRGQWRLDLATSLEGLAGLVKGIDTRTSDEAAAAVDLEPTMGALAADAREVDLGSVVLERPRLLGAVTFTRHWTERCDLELTVECSLLRLPGRHPGPGVWTASWRGGIVTAGEPMRFWSYGTPDTWSARGRPLAGEGSATRPTDRIWEPGDLATETARAGSHIELDYPGGAGLSLSVDLVGAPTAARLVIFAADLGVPRLLPGAALPRDPYRARLGSSAWSNVVPRSLAKGGVDSYEIGPTELPAGPLRLELWSLEGDGGARVLLATRDVSSGFDVPAVSLP